MQYANSFNAFLPYFGGSPLVKHALMHAYSGVSESTDVTERYRDGVARFVGDYFFTCSLIDFADIVADEVYGAVYMYYFTRRYGKRTECLSQQMLVGRLQIRGQSGWALCTAMR